MLWPFIFIVVLFSKVVLNKKPLDVDKLRRESQKLLEKERAKEEKLKQLSIFLLENWAFLLISFNNLHINCKKVMSNFLTLRFKRI